MHAILLRTIIRAPLTYHTSTDSGISLNRFSQDMTVIDNTLALAASTLFALLFLDLWSFGYVIYGLYYLAAFVPVLLGFLYLLQSFYLRTSRQLRYLDLEMKSPLFTHFSETFEGLVTIRVFRWQEGFSTLLLEKLDASQRAVYLLYCIQRWLNFSLDMFVAILAILLVTFATEFRNHSSGAAIGVAMLNVLSMSTALTSTIEIWTSVETSIGAVARVKQLEDDVRPEDLDIDPIIPPTGWPSSGAVRMDNVSAAYEGTVVLHDIDLRIEPGEKVGLCGRTGSGKSTLISILFRLVPVQRGSVYIGGTDLTALPREVLRSSIISIPQEPFLLMSGDVRFNMAPQSAPYNLQSSDPNNTAPTGRSVASDSIHIGCSTDAEITEALKAVGLWTELSSRVNGGNESCNIVSVLETPLSSLGLSHGQKQLLCLARAILRKNMSQPRSGTSLPDARILILDEATSSMDTQTDAKMREIIKAEFWKDYTVLMIAHRASSLQDCDRIVVLEDGRISNPDSAA